ncbi:divergent polysaccharide deacetylase family protein [Kiloniella litopenaei]|uniref:divergent polysaccharide deacetylase family protein n=1 Tax=Kiloniella litopenaei TaxID=1549748 RepID=UPI003BA99142
MNWKKILLITCWVALISVIGAAVGYTILGPQVPLPYQYVEEEIPQNRDDNHAPDEHSPDEHSGETTSQTEENVSKELSGQQVSDQEVSSFENNSQSKPDAMESETAPQPESIASTPDVTTTPSSEDESGLEDAGNEALDKPEETNKTTESSAKQPEQNTAKDQDTPSAETTDASPSTGEPTSPTTPQIAAIDPSPYPPNPPIFSTEPSWKLYGQKVPDANGRPRIAIVLTGLGLSRAATEAAIRQLPGEITLSFTPYAKNLESWIALARSHNHEVMLDLPMEPLTYPSDDPGPQALLTGRQPEGNLNNLAWIANRGSGYVGMISYMGSRFVTSERQMRPVMEYFKDHGLLFLDNGENSTSLVPSLGQSLGVPIAINQRAIDKAQLSREAIDARLVQVERIATKNGVAIATGRPFPVTLERIAKWVSTIEQEGYQLVPITAVIDEASLASAQDPSPSATINSPTVESN